MASNRWRCSFCRSPEWPWGLEFESTEPKCPRCRATGLSVIIPLVNVHFYALDPNGLIYGAGGRRYRVACSPEKINPKGIPCTGLPEAVTCPRCRVTREFQQAQEMAAELVGGILLE